MAINESGEARLSKSRSSSDIINLNVHGTPFSLDRKLLVSRSGKLALLFKDKQNEKFTYTLKDVPGDWETFNLAMRFCYGYEPNLTAENVVPLICVSYYLEMTEVHSPGNLLNKAVDFLQFNVLSFWNESIEALKATEHVFQQAASLRLVDACLDSIVGKARVNPRLLGVPLREPSSKDDEDDSDYRPDARKRLYFASDSRSADGLTSLSLRLYNLLMTKMIQCGVPSVYVAGSLVRYAKTWANVGIGDDGVLNCTNSHAREVIETVEKLLPEETGLVSCKLLFQMLQCAVSLQASTDCRYGFETMIGKQLHKAKVEDLLIPLQGYAMEGQYDTECVRRILKTFYSNYTSSDPSGLITVVELIEEFLAKVAGDIHLTKDKFISLAKMSVATSAETKRYSDGIYRAVDIYLDKHRYLTESEREEVCQVLDCYKLSPEACTHAARNERLPLRVVVQTLFVGQLQLRDAITSRVEDTENGSRSEEAVNGGGDGGEGEEVRVEMEKMDNRVMELENEYCQMRIQMEKGGAKQKGGSKWKALKRKFGCTSSIHDYNCQVKRKVHPRNGF